MKINAVEESWKNALTLKLDLSRWIFNEICFFLNFTPFKNSAKPTEKYKNAKQCWFFVGQMKNHEEMPNNEHARLMRKCLADMRFGEILDDVSGK